MTLPRGAPRAAALCAALLASSSPRSAPADPPPPPLQCAPEPPARRATVDVGHGALARVAAARDGDRVVVALRVLPGPREPRASARTRVLVGELGGDGAWARAPREVASMAGRVDGTLALAAREGARAVVFATARGARWLAVGDDASGDRDVVLARPTRGESPWPLVASTGDGFVLVWHRAGALELQRVGAARDAEPGAAVRARVPGGSDPVAAASGATAGTTALVVRSPGRRFFVALAGDDGRVAWTGNAPAGCDHGRCPDVRLATAAGGYVASWQNRPTRDGLENLGARSLGADGRIRGRAPALIPMAAGVAVAGPQGQALALQLGRPVVLRGAARPVALPLADGAPREFPAFATAWIAPDAPDVLEALTATRAGALTLARVRCEPAPR